MPAKTRTEYTAAVKAAAQGQWLDILERVGGIPRELLTKKGSPCPACGGEDRFALVSEDRGAVICRHCFSKKNGDGLSAIKHFCNLSFTDAVNAVGNYLNLDPPATKKNDPAKDLRFKPEIHDITVAKFQSHKPGITKAALEASGAQEALYRGTYQVLVWPIIGESLDVEKPVGWIAAEVDGKKLPSYDKHGAIKGYVKYKVMSGSGPGLVGTHAIKRLKTKGLVDCCWKVEGVTDMAVMQSLIPAPLRDKHVVVTNSNGTMQEPSWMGKFLAGREVCVVHDADEPGQAGAQRWTEAVSVHNNGSPVRNVMLPYPVADKSGKDLRDYLQEHDFTALMDLRDKTDPHEAPLDADGNVDTTKMQWPLQRQILRRLQVEILYEDERNRIRVFSNLLRKSSWINDVQRLTHSQLIQICGPVAMDAVDEEPHPPQSFSIDAIRKAFALFASTRRGRDNERGVGIWGGLDGHGNETQTVVLVNDTSGARYNGDTVLRRIEAPRADGLVLDFGSGADDWFDFEELKRLLEQAREESWRLEALQKAKSLYSQWCWAQADAPEIITGLIMASWLQTIWSWRPLVSVSGATNTGKSLFFESLGGRSGHQGVFGNLGFKQAKSTEAGIRQGLGNTARIVLCDEFEASKERTMILEKLFRPSTRGDSVARGTSDQKGMHFALRHIGWVAATETGLNKAPDANRFIMFDLVRPKPEDYGKLSLPDGPDLRILGQKLLAIAIVGSAKAKRLAQSIRTEKVKGIDPRTIESFSVPAACLAVAQGYSEDDARKYLQAMVAGNVDTASVGEGDEHDLLGDILDGQINFGSHTGTLTVSQALQDSMRSTGTTETLESYGIKRLADGVFISPRRVSEGLLRFNESWKGKMLDKLLLRVDGAERSRQRLAKRQQRGVIVPNAQLGFEDIAPDAPSDSDFQSL